MATKKKAKPEIVTLSTKEYRRILEENKLARQAVARVIEALSFYASPASYSNLQIVAETRPRGEFWYDISGKIPGKLARDAIRELTGMWANVLNEKAIQHQNGKVPD